MLIFLNPLLVNIFIVLCFNVIFPNGIPLCGATILLFNRKSIVVPLFKYPGKIINSGGSEKKSLYTLGATGAAAAGLANIISLSSFKKVILIFLEILFEVPIHLANSSCSKVFKYAGTCTISNSLSMFVTANIGITCNDKFEGWSAALMGFIGRVCATAAGAPAGGGALGFNAAGHK